MELKNVKVKEEISSYSLLIENTLDTIKIEAVENEELYYIETDKGIFIAHCKNDEIKYLIEWKNVAFAWKKNSVKKEELIISKELEEILF